MEKQKEIESLETSARQLLEEGFTGRTGWTNTHLEQQYSAVMERLQELRGF